MSSVHAENAVLGAANPQTGYVKTRLGVVGRLLPLAAAVLLLLGASGGAVARPATGNARVTSVSTAPRVFGLAAPGAPGDLAAVDEVAGLVGRAPQEITFYAAWSSLADFPAVEAARMADRGATPSVTWEPWDPAAGVDQPAYTLDSIAAGRHDAYVTRWARQVRSYGRPVVVRFAHEMNGGWYPWGYGVNGNGPGDYVAAWKHVVGVFRSVKATNVTWVWSPNVPYPASGDLAGLFPGDSYVDRVALDGYNWGTTQSWSAWQSFGDLFGPGVAQLRALSARPIHVAETGSTEVGGDKAAWITDMFAWLDVHPEVRGVTWFNFAKETDWRVQSSDASVAAFRAGIGRF